MFIINYRQRAREIRKRWVHILLYTPFHSPSFMCCTHTMKKRSEQVRNYFQTNTHKHAAISSNIKKKIAIIGYCDYFLKAITGWFIQFSRDWPYRRKHIHIWFIICVCAFMFSFNFLITYIFFIAQRVSHLVILCLVFVHRLNFCTSLCFQIWNMDNYDDDWYKCVPCTMSCVM